MNKQKQIDKNRATDITRVWWCFPKKAIVAKRQNACDYFIRTAFPLILTKLLSIKALFVVGAGKVRFFTLDRTGARHFLAATLTLYKVIVAMRIAAVDHSSGLFATVVAVANDRRIYRVYRHMYPTIKNIAIALKIFSTNLFAIINDAPMQLINILKTLLDQICWNLGWLSKRTLELPFSTLAIPTASCPLFFKRQWNVFY